MSSVPMTEQGLAKLRQNLAELEQERPRLLQAIRDAREKGDLSENAEYHAAREDLAMLEQKIQMVNAKIGSAQIIDPAQIGGDAVVFGATVRVQNLADDETEEFTLVGEGDADPFANRILTTSPMGQALLTKKVGQIAEVAAPKGTLRFKILEIRF